VKTGDIPAEWLRDASAQVRPYLFYAKSDPQVAQLLRAIIARMASICRSIRMPTRSTLDYRALGAEIELDSACGIRYTLAWTYWKETGDASIFTGDLSAASTKPLETMEREQDHARIPLHAQRDPARRQGQPGSLHRHDLSGFRPSTTPAPTTT